MFCSPRTCCAGGRTPLPPGRKPILCYVTDRRALEAAPVPSAIPAARTELRFASHSLHDSIRRAAAAGAGWIQIREKDLEGRALVELVRFAVAETRATSARVLVNDRLDVALAANAAGVHLGEKSLPLEIVREWRRSSRAAGFSDRRFLPFPGVRARGRAGRSGLHFFRAGVRDAVQGGIRRAAGNRTAAGSLRVGCDSGARHWRREFGKCSRVLDGGRRGDRGDTMFQDAADSA